MRWSLLIADFDYHLIHKAGKLHLNADGLSRAPTRAPVDDPESPHLDYLSEESDVSIDHFEVNLVNEVNVVGSVFGLRTLTCAHCLQREDSRKKLLICETCSYTIHASCA